MYKQQITKQQIKQELSFYTLVFIILFIFFLSHTASLSGQVTIGSLNEPAKGAILDLKSNVKGLGTPRVQLTAKRELYPMFSSTHDDYNTPAKKEEQDGLHTGLVVYATDLFEMTNCPGLYVWNGEEWEYLFPQQVETQPTIIDGEGNTYTYKKFGNLYWMTQNLRSITVEAKGVTPLPKGNYSGYLLGPVANLMKVQGDIRNMNRVEIASQSDLDAQGNISYVSNGLPITESFKEYLKKFGLLYNGYQAHQACPEGWRLPTVPEWENLERTIGQMIGVGSVVGNYEVFKTLKYPAINFGSENSTNPLAWGGYNICIAPEKELGFNVIPAGALYSTSEVWMICVGGYFWTSTLSDSATAWRTAVRDEASFGTKVDYGTYPMSNAGYSVRCVKPVS